MASKLVTDRQKNAELVLAISDAQGPRLATALSRSTGNAVLGTQAQAIVATLRTALLASRDAMVAADAAHESEVADDPASRDARDGVALVLGQRCTELREVLTGLYGSAIARDVFAGPTPQDPVVLARFAEEVAERLERITLPSSRVPGATFDARASAAELRARRSELSTQIEGVAREAREAQVTLAEKNRALAAFDLLFSGTAATLTGLFTLAGETELADRVRPTARRAASVEGQDEAASSGDPST